MQKAYPAAQTLMLVLLAGIFNGTAVALKSMIGESCDAGNQVRAKHGPFVFSNRTEMQCRLSFSGRKFLMIKLLDQVGRRPK